MKRRYVIEVQRDPQNPLHKESITCTKLDAVGMSLDLMRKKEFQIPGVTVGFFEEGKENLGYVFFMHRFWFSEGKRRGDVYTLGHLPLQPPPSAA